MHTVVPVVQVNVLLVSIELIVIVCVTHCLLTSGEYSNSLSDMCTCMVYCKTWNSGCAFCFTRKKDFIILIMHPTCQYVYGSAYRWIGNTITFMKPNIGVVCSVSLARQGLVSRSH